MKFYIDKAFITSVTIREVYYSRQRDGESSEDFLIRKLTEGDQSMGWIRSEDHPEFASLRNGLERQGYIKTQRSWWNGDYVLKPFYLNDKKFKKGEQFCCAGALKYDFE